MERTEILQKTPGDILIINDYVKIGTHVPFLNSSIHDTLKFAIESGMYSVQFYSGSSRQFIRKEISEIEIKKIKSLLKYRKCNIFIHASLVYNLAGSCKLNCLAWNGNEEVDSIIMKVIDGLNTELKTLNKIRGKGVVVHPGYWLRNKNDDNVEIEKSITSIAQTLDFLEYNGKAKILLENCAGEKGRIGVSLNELARIRDKCAYKQHIGYCLDTAHIHGSGIYDLSSMLGIDKLFQDIDFYGNVELIHLNDSKVHIGSLKDRHESIGKGTIWKTDVSPLKYLLEKSHERDIPIILETPSPFEDMVNTCCVINDI